MNLKKFFGTSLSLALELQVASAADILRYITPDVLANHLPRTLWARLLTACIGAPRVDAQLVIETIGVPNLCEYVPVPVLWSCLCEIARPDAARAQIAQTEPTARIEPARTEPTRPEPARTEPARPEPARPEPARPEPAREIARPETTRPETTRPETPRPEITRRQTSLGAVASATPLPPVANDFKTPQVTVGTLATPPVSIGTLATPPVSVGTVATPPVNVGTLATPPVNVGTLATPPVSVGTIATPPVTVGTVATPLGSAGGAAATLRGADIAAALEGTPSPSTTTPSRTRTPAAQRFRQSQTGIGRLAPTSPIAARRPQAAAVPSPLPSVLGGGRPSPNKTSPPPAVPGGYEVVNDVGKDDWKANTIAIEDEQLVEWQVTDETGTTGDYTGRKR